MPNPFDFPDDLYAAGVKVEEDATRNGVPALTDARFLLGYAIGRLRRSGATVDAVAAYARAIAEVSQGGRPDEVCLTCGKP